MKVRGTMTKQEITDCHPSIHCTGSVAGMKKLGYWHKDDICVKIGQHVYNLSITLNVVQSGE
jgi:hypothetical protein